MPAQIKTSPFGLQPVPAGRLPEAVASIPEAVRDRVARVVGRGIGDGDRFYRWPNRAAMAAQIRRDERSAPFSRYVPLQPLTDREGF